MTKTENDSCMPACQKCTKLTACKLQFYSSGYCGSQKLRFCLRAFCQFVVFLRRKQLVSKENCEKLSLQVTKGGYCIYYSLDVCLFIWIACQISKRLSDVLLLLHSASISIKILLFVFYIVNYMFKNK